ncbi:RNA polymerase sigma factor [Paenibacillus sp. V4I7]|uniref:RNA polymerase sigma factor n=1 Tax=Paenibacillus sp. V4I7 TaxID=3042307 RepID=UPI00278794E6|nr:RNA polymerase sigma factor [Paenibacillus sp. V4I7]MDQ0899938.1 RNA polymerase sigma factor (sigma-70 family) [Paenibacillus sp. V4I7]
MRIDKKQAEYLFNEHVSYVRQAALMLTKSNSLSDDIVQETFIRIFDKYHLFNPTKPIKPWLYKLTLNTTRNMLRKQKWLSFFGMIPDVPSPEIIESVVIKDASKRELLEVISRLPQKQREVIVMHFIEELKISEMAEILNVPVGTCKSRLHKALILLRNEKGGVLHEAFDL